NIEPRNFASEILVLETEPKACRALHSRREDFTRSMKYLAEISEQSRIETGAYLPAVLPRKRDGIFIVETIAPKPAQFGVAAERWLKIKGHYLIAGMKAQNNFLPERDDPLLIQKGNVLLSDSRQTVKRKDRVVLCVITVISGGGVYPPV